MEKSIRRDLLLYALVSSVLTFGALTRMEGTTWNLISWNKFCAWIAWSALAGLVQTALVTVRCMGIHRWASRRSPDSPPHPALLGQHVPLVTLAALLGAIGIVVVYDGYWRLYDAYSRPYPNEPWYLSVLWFLGYVIGAGAVLVYGGVMVRQIKNLYRISSYQGILALAVGLVPEIVFYGVLAAAWIAFVLIAGPLIS